MTGLAELKQLELFIHRYHLGTIRDRSDHGYDGSWVGGSEPRFSRDFAQVRGLSFGEAGPEFIEVANVPFDADGDFSIEVLFFARSAGGASFGRIFAHSAGGVKELYINGPGGDLLFNCGSSLITSKGSFIGAVQHVIVSRASNVGYVFQNGRLIDTGTVGSNYGTGTLNIGSSFANNFDGLIYLFRMLDTRVAEDEASLLYERSRVLLLPGAQRRSGIVSAL